MPSWADWLLHLFWPTSCPVCGRTGTSVCFPCLDSLLEPSGPLCLECGGAVYPCPRHPNAPFIMAGALYPGKSRELVAALKYKGFRETGYHMGAAMGSRIRPVTDGCLVPIPLHRGSRRDYNQSLCIARGLASVWRLPVRDILRWKLKTSPQTQRSAAQRRECDESCFSVHARVEQPVILVDDILTTGATLKAAAGAIMRAGGDVCGGVVWGLSPPPMR